MPSHGTQLPQVLLFLRTMSCVTNAKKDVWITISNFPFWLVLCLKNGMFVIMTDELGSVSIGFLGMGIMGSPMAQNLLKAG